MSTRRTTLRILLGMLAPALALAGTAPVLADTEPAVTNVHVDTQQANAAQTRWELAVGWDALSAGTSYDVKVVDSPTGGHVYGTTNTTSTTVTVEATDLTPGADYFVVVTGNGVAANAGSARFTAKRIDFTAPTGRFSFLDGTTAWTNGSVPAELYLEQRALADNVTRPGQIEVAVDLGDGRPPVPWASGADFELGNVFDLDYARPGTYHPSVRLTDAAGNVATVELPAVSVRLDTVAPRVSIARPSPSRRHHVAAWRIVRGHASDPGSGQMFFVVGVWQQRSHRWYTYSFGDHHWHKGKRSLQATLQSSTAQPDFQTAFKSRAWRTPRIKGLITGKLHVRVFAGDIAGNTVEVKHTERLTSR